MHFREPNGAKTEKERVKMLDICPNDVMFLIAEMLSPKDVSNIASCNKWFRSILPIRPLRIRIMKTTAAATMDNDDDVVMKQQDHCLLDPYFFVSEYPSERPLNHEDSLRSNQSYRFWQFDYERSNRVLLMQHLPVHLVDGDNSYLSHGFDITLVARPVNAKVKTPNTQTWRIMDAFRDEDDNKKKTVMSWGSVVNISIGGEIQNDQFRGEFWSRTYLTAVPVKGQEDDDDAEKDNLLWYSNPVRGENTKLRILREDDCNNLMLLNHGNNDSSSALSEQDSAPTKRNKKQKLTLCIGTTYATLNIRAIPVLHQGIGTYGIYSARSLEKGSIEFHGRQQDNVEFQLSSNKGYLQIEAMAPYHMPFRLVVPMRRKRKIRPNSHAENTTITSNIRAYDYDDETYDAFYYRYKEEPDEDPLLEVMTNLRKDYADYVRYYLRLASVGDYTSIQPFINRGIYDPDMRTIVVQCDLLTEEVKDNDDDRQENNGEEKNQNHINDVGNDHSVIEDTDKTSGFSPWEKQEFANLPKDSSQKFICIFVRKRVQTYPEEFNPDEIIM